MAEGTSNHTPLLLSFPHCPRHSASFKYCDMWSKDPQFQPIVAKALKPKPKGSKMHQLIEIAEKAIEVTESQQIRGYLQPTCHYSIRVHTKPTVPEPNEPTTAIQGMRRQNHIIGHIRLLHQTNAPTKLIGMAQQWRSMHKFLYRKQANYIYSINDANGHRIDGFLEVTKVITEFYPNYLEIKRGCGQKTEAKILQIAGFTIGSLPFRYLGVPIIASRLSKLECRGLVDKTINQNLVHKTHVLCNSSSPYPLSAIRHLYILCKVFISPQEVIHQFTAPCRNFVWGAESTYKKVPYVAWKEVCMPKANGGDRSEEFGSLEQSMDSKISLGHSYEEGQALDKMDPWQIFKFKLGTIEGKRWKWKCTPTSNNTIKFRLCLVHGSIEQQDSLDENGVAMARHA
ncbi:LOW QUALITY PROTEIN: hypothetical protein Cgig2_016330 [Carnegiea gigantea]|uniref:Uncharacterized protein n=1 Tax=Carnegiea gigantea TaxID=171969 RepID=A0A9Q1JW81_9CARY|nr:LOW QUALITY PROTEIN: hypothetical protein Cgig2_016330 [Carnegiea gigantea]